MKKFTLIFGGIGIGAFIWRLLEDNIKLRKDMIYWQREYEKVTGEWWRSSVDKLDILSLIRRHVNEDTLSDMDKAILKRVGYKLTVNDD